MTDSFGAAQNNVVGLNSHYVLYESEINSIKNINYPTIVTEVPNSSIENVNRGMETFEVVVFVLKHFFMQWNKPFLYWNVQFSQWNTPFL